MKTDYRVFGARLENGGWQGKARGSRFNIRSRLRRLSSWCLALLLCALAPSRGGATGLILKTLQTFYGTNGALPYAGLTLDTNSGIFYGTTSAGGAHNQGTVFALTPSGMMTTLSFDGINGARPMGALIFGQVPTNGFNLDGYLYGTTSAGGDYSNGTVFAVSLAGPLFTNIYPLASFEGGTNGAQPECSLVQDPRDGTFYGTTYLGGQYGFGTVFSFPWPGMIPPPKGSTVIKTLGSFDNTNSGAYPASGLALDYDGNLYGTTSTGGGAYDAGTFYGVDTFREVLYPLWSFSETNGAASRAPLLLSTNVPSNALYYYATIDTAITNAYSFLYATTAGGGDDQYGAIVGLTPDGSLTNVVFFSFGLTNGSMPAAGLIQGTDGSYYGATTAGGGSDSGAFFRFNPSNSTPIELLYSFPGAAGGGSPYGALVQGTNSDFYGTTLSGGQGKKGTVFQITGFLPYLITQPTNTDGQLSNSISLAVLAGGSAPLRYQWFCNSNQLGNSTRISGATSPFLTLNNAQLKNTGTYYVRVQNSYGSTNSTNVTLTIVEPYGQQRPVLKITGPAQNKYLSSAEITVTGTTATTVTVSQVSFRLNGGGWQAATPFRGFKTWSAQATLSPGITNVFEAYAVNIVGITSPTNVAYFLLSPFAPIAGAYNGLFYNTNNVTETNAGFFTLDATYLGKFSGSLQLAGGRYPFAGQFGLNGFGQATAPMGKSPPLTVRLQLDMTNATGHITGSVSNAAWTADLAGDLAVFNSLTNVAPQQGAYTLLIPGAAATPQPAGDGWGAVSVDAGGNIHLAGSLADGTPLVQTVPVSPAGLWPLYESLYGGQGMLLGWLAFPSGASAGPAGQLLWLKSPLAKGTLYTNGITLQTPVQSSLYTPPPTWAGLFTTTNLVLTLGGGDLAQSITNLVKLGPKNQAASLSSNKLSLSFSLPAGSFNGSVANPAASKPISFTGVVLQNQGAASGFFLGPSQSGAVSITPAPTP